MTFDEWMKMALARISGDAPVAHGRDPKPGEHPWATQARVAMENALWGLPRRAIGGGLALLDAPNEYVTRPLGGLAYQQAAKYGGGMGVDLMDTALKTAYQPMPGIQKVFEGGRKEYYERAANLINDNPDRDPRAAWESAYEGRDLDKQMAEGIYDPTNLAGVGIGKGIAKQATKAAVKADVLGLPKLVGSAIDVAGEGVAKADRLIDWTQSAPVALPLKGLKKSVQGIDYLNTLRKRMKMPDADIDGLKDIEPEQPDYQAGGYGYDYDFGDVLSESEATRGTELPPEDDWYFSGEQPQADGDFEEGVFRAPTSGIRAGSDENLRRSLADYDRRKAARADELKRMRERVASDTPPPPPPLEQARILEDRGYNAMRTRQADERIKQQRMTNIATEELERSLQQYGKAPAEPEAPIDALAEMEAARKTLATPLDEGPVPPSIDQLGKSGGYLDQLRNHIGDQEFEVGTFSDHLQRNITDDDVLLRDQLASITRTDEAIKAGRLTPTPEAQARRDEATTDLPAAAADLNPGFLGPKKGDPTVALPPGSTRDPVVGAPAGPNALDTYVQALRQNEARMGMSDQEYYGEAVPGEARSQMPRSQAEIGGGDLDPESVIRTILARNLQTPNPQSDLPHLQQVKRALDQDAAARQTLAQRETVAPLPHQDLTDADRAWQAYEQAETAKNVAKHKADNPLVRPDARAHEVQPEPFEEGRLDMPWRVAAEQRMAVRSDGLTMVPGETLQGYKDRVAVELEEEYGRSYDAGVGLNPPETTQAAIDFVTSRMFSGATWASTINELKILVGRPPDTVADFRDKPPAHLNQAEPVLNPNTGEYENPYKTAPGAATWIPTGKNKFREFMRKFADTPRAMYNPPEGLKTGDLPREPIDIKGAYSGPEDKARVADERKATLESRWGGGSVEGHVSDPLLPGTVHSRDIGGHQRGSDSPKMQQYKAAWHAHKLKTMEDSLTALAERRAALGKPELGTEPQTVTGFKGETLETRGSEEDEALAYVQRAMKQRYDRLRQMDPYGGEVPTPETIDEWHEWHSDLAESMYEADLGSEAFQKALQDPERTKAKMQEIVTNPNATPEELAALMTAPQRDIRSHPIDQHFIRPVRIKEAKSRLDDADLKGIRTAADEALGLPLDELEGRMTRGVLDASERGVGRWQRRVQAPGVQVPEGLNPQQRQRLNRKEWRRFQETEKPGKAYVHMPVDTEKEIAFIREQFGRERARQEGVTRSKKMRKITPFTPRQATPAMEDLGTATPTNRPDDLPLKRDDQPTPIRPGTHVERGGKYTPTFRGEKWFLSNLSPAKVTIDGVEYPSSEAAYYAARTDDPDLKEKLRTSTSGGHAKNIGGKANLDPDDDKRMLAMIKVIRAKFKQNPDLRARLLATGEETLEEGNNWGDDFWGVDRIKGGQNMLGHILMEVRDEIRRGEG